MLISMEEQKKPVEDVVLIRNEKMRSPMPFEAALDVENTDLFEVAPETMCPFQPISINVAMPQQDPALLGMCISGLPIIFETNSDRHSSIIEQGSFLLDP